MGFDFVIEYKAGVTNRVADALLLMYEDEENLTASFMAMSEPRVGLIPNLKRENESLDELLSLHHKMDRGEILLGFRRENELLIYRDRYFLDSESKRKMPLPREFNDTPSSGHGGTKKMLVRLSALFY
nr:Ty3/gypsy retrotransposon protein [Tanacetum cinerariifolium]